MDINSESIFDKLIYEEKINRGFSNEEKYKVKIYEDTFLLKITPNSNIERKNLEVKYLNKLINSKINFSNLYSIDYSKDNIKTLYQWIEGVDFIEFSKKLNKESLYKYGVEAGKILRKIHSININEKVVDWEEYYNTKIEKKINSYNKISFYYPNGKKFIDFINSKRFLLKNRPQTLCHGDYHVGNMMIENITNKLYIIDFGSIEVGDPYEEFNRIIWSAQLSEDFATGLINGYFTDEKIPENFWGLMALYMAVDVVGSLYWAIDYGEDQIKVMINRANNVLKWYDDFKLYQPNFYIS